MLLVTENSGAVLPSGNAGSLVVSGKVFGCGLVGLGAIIAASEQGLRVIAVDIDETKLQTARSYGAGEILNSKCHNFKENVLEITGNEGPDVVIEAVGIADTFKLAVELVSFGGFVVYIGYVKEPVSYETKLFVSKELSIMGSRNALNSDFEKVIGVMKSNRFDFNPLITRTFPIGDAVEAFRFWEEHRNEVFKIILTVEQEK